MVRLLEYEVKDILKKYDLPIPKQFTNDDLNDPSIYPVVIKSQVPIGGRGKLGGIKFANNQKEAVEHVQTLKSHRIKGYLPETLLIEEQLQIQKEFYCGFIMNRDEKRMNFIFSESGGVDIEEVSKQARDIITIKAFIPSKSNYNEQAEKLLKDIKLDHILRAQLKNILGKLLQFILDNDAELFESNPLVETQNHELIIADARMNIDDNALYRHEKYKKNLEYYLNPLELQARNLNMSYVELEGNIGVICNGAGLVMGTIDTIQSYGGKAANFLDVGGGANADRMYHALKLISINEKVRVILINIIGGITRCDEIAKGLIKFFEENKKISFFLRLIGTNEKEGQELLLPYGIIIHRTLDDAIRDLLSFL